LWRQVNGTWQLHRDIFNSSVPPSKWAGRDRAGVDRYLSSEPL